MQFLHLLEQDQGLLRPAWLKGMALPGEGMDPDRAIAAALLFMAVHPGGLLLSTGKCPEQPSTGKGMATGIALVDFRQFQHRGVAFQGQLNHHAGDRLLGQHCFHAGQQW